MIIISDTSPIINLAMINRLDLLPQLFGEVIIPQSVYEEITIKGKGEPGEVEIKNADWIKVIKCKNLELVSELEQILNSGESESIALAMGFKNSILLIDESEGRKVAKQYNIKVLGLLGILLQAKKMDLIQSVKVVMDDLIHHAGFWVNEELYMRILKIANE